MTTSTPIYDAIMWEVRKQILELGLTMKQCDDVSGNQDGHTAKMLHPDTPSGRQARWETLQNLVEAIYAGGYKVKIVAECPIDDIKAAVARILARQGDQLSGLSVAERSRARGIAGKIPIRDYAVEAGRKGGQARAARLSPWKRRQIARKAGRARHRRNGNGATT